MYRLFLLVLLPLIAHAENWPQWRGPTADGVSADTGVAMRWSPTENVAWKAPIEGWGTSTPIVWEGKIFLTTQVGDGPISGTSQDFSDATAAARMEGSGVRFVVKSLSLKDGSLRWERSFDATGHIPEVHIKHNLASPSCVTDGKTVYAWFGTGLVVALNFDGELLWQRNLGEDYTPFDVKWGHGSSPTLYGDSLLLLVEHPLESYLLSVDKATGKTLWKSDRGSEKRSYTTPFVIRKPAGDELIVNTNAGLEALDPASGELIWRQGEDVRVPIAVPVYHDGVIYSSRGYTSSPYLAVQGDGKEVRWRVATGGPYISSVIYHDGVVYMANERGIASAVDASNGELLWRKRLSGSFTASPVKAGGKLYFVEESGKTYVIEPSREFKLIAENDLGERTLASPAISDGLLLIRTDDHLWAIGAR